MANRSVTVKGFQPVMIERDYLGFFARLTGKKHVVTKKNLDTLYIFFNVDDGETQIQLKELGAKELRERSSEYEFTKLFEARYNTERTIEELILEHQARFKGYQNKSGRFPIIDHMQISKNGINAIKEYYENCGKESEALFAQNST